MAVKQVTVIKNFIGLSTDVKPTGVPSGSTFWEYDTNILAVCQDGTNWSPKDIKSVVLPGTVNLQQAAGNYTLFTAVAGTVYVERFSLVLPNVNCADDATITSIAVVSDTAAVITLLSAAAGAKANLVANAAFAFSSPFALPVGKLIRLVIAGGAADASTLCTLSVRYQAVTPGAYLS